MKFDKGDILVKVRQAALCARVSEAVVEKMLAGRRHLDNYEKVVGQVREQ